MCDSYALKFRYVFKYLFYFFSSFEVNKFIVKLPKLIFLYKG